MTHAQCGGTITLTTDSPTGTLESPGYPGPYPSNSDCVWTLEAPVGFAVRFVFTNADLASIQCDTHIVSFYDGPDVNSALKANFTGMDEKP